MNVSNEFRKYGLNTDVRCCSLKENQILIEEANDCVSHMARQKYGSDPYWSARYNRLRKLIKTARTSIATAMGSSVQDCWNKIVSDEYFRGIVSIPIGSFGVAAEESDGVIYACVLVAERTKRR